jgi:hypothetical protein
METAAIDFLNSTDFSSWCNPRIMWDRAMTVDALLSRGDLIDDSRSHKFREVLSASTFATGFCHLVRPVQVRMKDEELLDFELQADDKHNYEFELVTAYEDGRKPGDEHRNLSDDSLEVIKKPSVEPIDLRPIVQQVIKKTKKLIDLKAKDLNVRRHLLVYCSIVGGRIDEKSLYEEVAKDGLSWESIWLIRGVPDLSFMALLCNSFGFKCPMGEWLPNWEWAQKRSI